MQKNVTFYKWVTLKFPHLAGLQHNDRNAVIL